MWNRAFDVQRRSVGLPRVQDELNIVLGFIDYVLSCLSDPMRANVEQVFSKLELGYNVKDDRVGVLFADHFVDFRLPSSLNVSSEITIDVSFRNHILVPAGVQVGVVAAQVSLSVWNEFPTT